MHIKIIEGCIVCRQCECQAPDVFEVAEKAHSSAVRDAHPPAHREPDVIRAIKGCPVHVIKLKRDTRGVDLARSRPCATAPAQDTAS